MEKLKKSTIIILAVVLLLALCAGFFAGFEITRAQERNNVINLNGEHIRSVFSSLNIEDNITSTSRDFYASGDFKVDITVSIQQKVGMSDLVNIFFEDGSALSAWSLPITQEKSLLNELKSYYPEPEEYGYIANIAYYQLNGSKVNVEVVASRFDKAYTEEFWNFVSQQIDKAISEATVQEVA